MGDIIYIEDYLNKKKEVALTKRIEKLAFGQWESEEEQIRYMTGQAESDLEEWDKLYPIQDIAE